MRSLEFITSENWELIIEVGPELTATYQKAFAGEPWYEVSRCLNQECSTDFTALCEERDCPECATPLQTAYEPDELIENWQNMIINEDACMELEFVDNKPQRATIARPTSPDELFDRKYRSVESMRGWIETMLPDRFAWIEDTFADREIRPRGNLRQRGQTIERIAEYYGGVPIATRTLSEAVVAATLRDFPQPATSVYVGDNNVGQKLLAAEDNVQLVVPDKRTFLKIETQTKE